MTKYVALLRAVNVGGRVVKMDELKKLFIIPGISNISTYIQSGNVLFETKEAGIAALQTKIEQKLLKALGYEVTVFLKTYADLESVIKKNPFKKEMEDGDLYVSFLNAKPAAADVQLLDALKADHEQFIVKDNNAYLLFPKKSYGTTKLSNANLEKKMKVRSTSRNWNTINKLAALLAE